MGFSRLAVCALLVAAAAAAAAARADGPLRYVRAALEFNAEIAAAEARLSAAREGVKIARAFLFPQIVGNVSNRLDAPPRGGRRLQYSATLTQLLFNPVAKSMHEQADSMARLAGLRADAARQSLILQVYRAYMLVVLSRESLAIIARRENTLRQQLFLAQSSYEFGRSTLVELLNVRSQVVALEAEKAAESRRLETSRRNLERLAGLRPGFLPGLSGEPAAPAHGMEFWVRKAGNAPLVRAAMAEFRSQQLATDALRGLRLPAASFVATANRDEESFSVALSMPLFSSGAATAGLRQSLASEEALGYALQSVLRKARLDAASAYLAINEKAEIIRSLEAAVLTLHRRLEAAEALAEAGSGALGEVLDAAKDLAETDLKLLSARHDRLLSMLELEAAAGTLTPEAARNYEHLFSN